MRITVRSSVRKQKREMSRNELRPLKPEERLRLSLELSDFVMALEEAGTSEQACQDDSKAHSRDSSH